MVNTTEELADLRKDIDFLDNEIMKFLVRRFEITKKVRRYKKANKLPVMDKAREEHIVREKIENSGLPRKFIKDFYKLIFEESRRIQR
jgi:chorismate mutase